MKKWIAVLSLLEMVCLTACSASHCKAGGCNDDVYKDGYCEYHYTVNNAKNNIDKFGKEVFDALK